MAQQSATRDRDNQAATPYLEYAALIWTRSAPRVRRLDLDPVRELPCRPAALGRIEGRTDGSIRLRVTAILTFSLAQKGASTDVARTGWLEPRAGRSRGGAPVPSFRMPPCRSTYGPPRLQGLPHEPVRSVYVNVSGLGAPPRPRWRSARSGPQKAQRRRAPLNGTGFRNTGRLSGHLASTTRRPRQSLTPDRRPRPIPCATAPPQLQRRTRARSAKPRRPPAPA